MQNGMRGELFLGRQVGKYVSVPGAGAHSAR